MSQPPPIPPPPLCEDDLENENENEGSDNNIHPSSSSSMSSAMKADEMSNHNTVGVSQSQRHFARLCSILSDPTTDMDTVRLTLRRGVPDELRMDFWRLALGVVPLGEPGKREKTLESLGKDYEHILALTCEDIKDGGVMDPAKNDKFPIDADVPRTMPSLHFFASQHDAVGASSPKKTGGGASAPASAFEAGGGGGGTALSPLDGVADSECANGEVPQEESSSSSSNSKSQQCNSNFSVGSPAHIQNFTPTQLALRRILFLFSRVHPHGYTQGMNEMCGLLLWAASNGRREAVHEAEPDVFFAFQSLVQWVGDHFSTTSDTDADSGLGSTLLLYSRLLQVCDPELAAKVEELQIVPEFYSFRWISILFALEFPVADVLSLWDFLLSFADKISIAAQFVAVSMMVHLRDQLLALDMGRAIQLLQNYPPVDVADIIATADALINRYTLHPHLWGGGGGGGGATSPAGSPLVPAPEQQAQVDSDAEEEDLGAKVKAAKNKAVNWLSAKWNEVNNNK